MELQVINPGFEYMIEKIMGFQTEETTAFWSEPLYYVYPQLDREYAASLTETDRKTYVEKTLRDIYIEQESVINEKVSMYTKQWEVCKPQITEALSEAFEIDCTVILNDMKCNISMNPIEPRYLTEHSFDIFYLNSEKGAIGEAIHEIIHFVWFYVWHELFRDGYEEYESPSLKWILSEMVVESVMKDSRLRSINPYFKREDGGCIYPYFFDMKVENKLILETLDEMYRTQSIVDFMKKSYSYCVAHETEIRNHIREAEQSGGT